MICTKDEAKRVADSDRLVFSTLTPIFNQMELQNETKTGGPIQWINVPHAAVSSSLHFDLVGKILRGPIGPYVRV